MVVCAVNEPTPYRDLTSLPGQNAKKVSHLSRESLGNNLGSLWRVSGKCLKCVFGLFMNDAFAIAAVTAGAAVVVLLVVVFWSWLVLAFACLFPCFQLLSFVLLAFFESLSKKQLPLRRCHLSCWCRFHLVNVVTLFLLCFRCGFPFSVVVTIFVLLPRKPTFMITTAFILLPLEPIRLVVAFSTVNSHLLYLEVTSPGSTADLGFDWTCGRGRTGRGMVNSNAKTVQTLCTISLDLVSTLDFPHTDTIFITKTTLLRVIICNSGWIVPLQILGIYSESRKLSSLLAS